MTILEIDVTGLPAPQGSKNHVGNGVMVESSKALKPWRQAVRFAALEGFTASAGRAEDCELELTATFRFDRPKAHWRPVNSRREFPELRTDAPRRPIGKPDLSKLVRAIEDAMQDAGIYKDDSQITELHTIKTYCAPGQVPGAHIIVRRIA